MFNGKRIAAYIMFFASLSLLLALGGWQWRRGLDKAAIEAVENSSNQIAAPIIVAHRPPDWAALAYRQVQLQGAWLGRDFLLANRVYRAQAGYEVFGAFQLADRSVLLVNRGWVADPADVSRPTSTQVSGQLYLPQRGFTLGAAITDTKTWPRITQYLDLPAMSAALAPSLDMPLDMPLDTPPDINLQPAVIVIAVDHPDALIRIWRAVSMTASRHYAYAVQWWGLAAVLSVFGYIWGYIWGFVRVRK